MTLASPLISLTGMRPLYLPMISSALFSSSSSSSSSPFHDPELIQIIPQRPSQIHRRGPHTLHHRPRQQDHRNEQARRQEQAIRGRGQAGRRTDYEVAKIRTGGEIEGQREGVRCGAAGDGQSGGGLMEKER